MIRKVALSVISLASGSALGFEGPALLIGSTVGSSTERFTVRRFRQDDAKVLMVAGAAAGVAAIFEAPLTGVCFALEVPYRADLARRALPAALAAGGASYLAYVTLTGTEPLFRTGGATPFNVTQLLGRVALGIACGVLARLGSWAIGHAKQLPLPRSLRIGATAAALGMTAVVANWWFHEPLHLGPSYETIDWVTRADRGVAVLIALFAVRAATTWLSVAAGGVGMSENVVRKSHRRASWIAGRRPLALCENAPSYRYSLSRSHAPWGSAMPRGWRPDEATTK